MKPEKNKNILPSMSFVIKQTMQKDKKIFFYSFLSVPFQVLDRLVDVYLVAIIVDLVVGGLEKKLLYVTLAIALYKLFAELVQRYSEWQLSTRNYRTKMKFISKFASKYMQTDFATMESTEGKDMARRARNAMAGVDYREKSAVETVFIQSAALVGNFCGLFVYAGIIAVLNPLIIVLLVLTSGIDYLLQRYLVQYDQKDKGRYIPLERRLWYLVKEMRDLGAAKDIRLYGMMGWIRQVFGENLKARMKLHTKRSRYQYAFVVVINVINTVFTGFIYYYLITRYLNGGIDISGFIVYFGLITGFNTWLMSVITNTEELHRILLNIEDLRGFIEVPDRTRQEAEFAATDPVNSIRFENVTFGYQEGQSVIKDMNFYVEPGEKIAIVGLNGAGKTTMIKLLCGLYESGEGKVYIDGRDVQTFGKEELFEKIAVVFQDIYLLPTSIERNITLTDKADQQRLQKVLELSGLQKKVDILPDKEKTVLVKSVLEEAIDLSGGEIQKLAFARALYKGGEIFVLDEPTAKLDPLAENEMYLKYNELTKGKTSIFISHRLSSTRFCDRIFYLENGKIIESGTHDALMAMGGAYAKMFETQSRYYKEQEAAPYESMD